eukprot:CAMPEP_0114982836 /NCGR_PEP_ID=MMETSP0216-20121206/6354_1 /TAXON_ID=223996 /ORGANISM="Protocruzia adherens, Strain Boccale" /LENGTH=168 /DNA_ID=CAMNT_0002344729 /DNA_START=853 /DNA_END=1356 /DNA_ORIENTATION=-
MERDQSQNFLIVYPLVLSMTEKLTMIVAGQCREIDKLGDEHLYPCAALLVAFFEAVKYAVAVYSFDEDNIEALLQFLLVGAASDIVGRNRLFKRLMVYIAAKVDKKPHIVPERRRFDQGVYACKYEVEYMPLLFLLFIRATNWVIIAKPGNHLNREGVPDEDFNLPIW